MAAIRHSFSDFKALGPGHLRLKFRDSEELLFETGLVADGKLRMIGGGDLPSPIVGDLFVIEKNEVKLARVGRCRRAVRSITVLGLTAITSPTVAPPVFIFVSSQPLQKWRSVFQDHRQNQSALFGVTEASPPDSLHPLEGDLDLKGQRAIFRLDGREGNVVLS